MTPREHKKHLLKLQREAQEQAEAWHVPLVSNGKKLKTALKEMSDWRLDSKDVPWIIRAIENPKSLLCEFGIFPGCVNLFSHDCIHIILGRGILPKDEAFVIGFTMGSTKRLGWLRTKIFLFISRWLYPEGYKFYKEERQVFEWAVLAGQRCKKDLTKVDFDKMRNNSITAIRKALGIETKFIKICYLLEKKLYPHSKESKILV